MYIIYIGLGNGLTEYQHAKKRKNIRKEDDQKKGTKHTKHT